MRKKILLALYAYKPFANANTNVVLPVIEAMSQKYEIDLVTQNNNGSALEVEKEGNITVYRYLTQDSLHKKLDILYYMDPYKRRDPIKNLVLPVLHGFSAALHQVPYFQNGEYRLLKRLLQENSYDCVITTCESFLSCFHVLCLKKKGLLHCPWITYFMDPFAKYIKNLDCPSFLKQELEIYQQSSFVLTTEEIYEQNKRNEFSQFLYKTRPVRFCNFDLTEYPLKSFEFIPGKINCVYIGSLNDEMIRSPKYFLKMLRRINDDRFAFHMICNRLTNSRLNEFTSILGSCENVYWYSSLPMNVCKGIMHHADILINLGNKMDNQTPSKIFEYIGTGKPIINFYSLPNDTSKRYLEVYPNKLNIWEAECAVDEAARMFCSFILAHHGDKVPVQEIRNQYQDYLSDQASKHMLEVIEQFLETDKYEKRNTK